MDRIKLTIYSLNKDIAMSICEAVYAATFKVEDYFDCQINDVSVVVARNHVHYCQLIDEDRPPWAVTKHKSGKIFLYDPTLWTKKATGHDTKDLFSSMAHEIVHLYFFLMKLTCPIWFEEGLAILVGNHRGNGDYRRLVSKYGVPNILQIRESFSQQKIPALAYLTSYEFVRRIVRRFGKEQLKKLVELLHNMPFPRAFRIVYGYTLEQVWTEFRREVTK